MIAYRQRLHVLGRHHCRRCLSLAAVLVLSLPLVGCGKRSSPPPPRRAAKPQVADGAPQTVVFVLFDLSGSTSAKPIRDRYERDFAKIVEQLKGGELVMGDVITENTLATASYPINQSFPRYDPWTTNRMKHKRTMEKAVATVAEQAKKVIHDTKAAPRTDLMNAFELAAKVFNGEQAGGAANKALVVFSDMVEQSRRYDFTGVPLDKKQANALIEKERAAGRLPKLEGAKVWVAGASAKGLASGKFHEIQAFWLAYFTACGAELTSERYAATLINFELPKGE